MVKIIRCASTNENSADFTSYFNEQIYIKSGAKIALESLSVKLNNNVISIPDQCTITVNNNTTGGDPNTTITIPADNYTPDEFIAELQYQLNTTKDIRTQSTVNTEYKPYIDENYQLNIQWLTNLQDWGSQLLTKSQYESTQFTVVAGIEPVGISDTIIHSANPAVDNDVISTNEPMSLSCGGVNATLLGDNTTYTTTGFTMGLITKELSGIRQDISVLNPNVYLALSVSDTGIVRIYSQGVQITPTQVEEVSIGAGNQYKTSLVIYKEQTRMSIYMKKNDALVPIQLLPEEHSAIPGGDLYGFIAMSEPAQAVTGFGYLPSPYVNSNSTGVSKIKYNSEKQDYENLHIFDNVGRSALVATVHTLGLGNIAKILLGFTKFNYEETAIGAVYVAENAIPDILYQDNILVEIPSLGLECFDSTRNGRRNIIKFVPVNKMNTTNAKEYIAPYPTYINIRNQSDTYINSIQVRLLDMSNTPLELTGENGSAEVTLIIED